MAYLPTSYCSPVTTECDGNGLRIYRYLLTDIGKTLSCTVRLTKEDKIAGFELTEHVVPGDGLTSDL